MSVFSEKVVIFLPVFAFFGLNLLFL